MKPEDFKSDVLTVTKIHKFTKEDYRNWVEVEFDGLDCYVFFFRSKNTDILYYQLININPDIFSTNGYELYLLDMLERRCNKFDKK